MTGTARIIRGNALALPIADATVDLIVTSPPYFGLRSYQDGGEHYEGQIGAEPTPAEFVDALIAATREMVRVLKPSGSIWVNLGDKYAGQSGSGDQQFSGQGARDGNRRSRPARVAGIPGKSLMGIPWRYAIRCIDDLGLILRAEVIWAKPNGLPESVTDRVRRSHEQWFHFTKSPRYYSAVDEIREAHSPNTSWKEPGRYRTEYGDAANTYNGGDASGLRTAANPLGKLPGSVWTIPTQPLQVPAHLGVDHFAAFPMEFPRRIIRGWSPAGVCTECGEGRRPVVARPGLLGGDNNTNELVNGKYNRSGFNGGQTTWAQRMAQPDYIASYACGCPEPTALTTPGVVLDPFGGTGTTALLAKANGRDGVHVDMSADYCRLAEWRTTDPGQMAAALQVEKPEPVHPDQLDLFAEDIA